ncbi:hypothetical protein ABEB36_004082 [Hypothenemus hampei]|uniref:Uncharacterized protein n=1 Tax=Hypothenemus hampei TaxID=57062 RepID=A0ABD1F3H3_HYPHA
MKSENQNTVPKEGGWGYVIVAATVVLINISLYANGVRATMYYYNIFNVFSYFKYSILACFLLMRFSYRKVSFLGSIIFLVGAISRIFVQNVIQFIISVGFIENLGAGLLMSASLTALNSNFAKKIALMTCLHETAVHAFGFMISQLAHRNEEIFNSRETLIGLALLSCLCLPASAMLKPPPKQNTEPQESVIPPDDRIASRTIFNTLSKELTLLKSYKYWNVIIGVSLAVIADYFFFVFLPILNQAVSVNQETDFSIIYYSAPELIFKILLTIVLAFVRLNSRLLILFTSAFVVFIRFAFAPHIDAKCQHVLFECLKCFTEAPVPLVFSEEYKDNFATAYSIFLVISSVLSLIFSGLIRLIFNWSDPIKKIEYIPIAAYATCVVIWTLEFIFFRKKPSNKGQNLNENQ